MGRIGAVPALVLVLALTSSCRLSSDKAKLEGIPDIPANVELRFVDKGLQVSWKPDARPASYYVFWGKEEGVYDRVIDSSAPPVVLGDLQKGTFYTIAVTARNEWGESEYSEEQAVIYDDDPGKASEYLVKAKDMIVKGYHREAMAYLAAVIRLDPDNPDPYRYRAALNEKLGRVRLVKEDLALAEAVIKRRSAHVADSPPEPVLPFGINKGIGPR
ncbi:MAG: fibronectin type III domain-containing protein [Thermodesulfobacteriota bacterium]